MNTAELLGEHLTVLRKRSKLSIDETAERANLNRRTLMNIEAGRSNVNLATLEAIVAVYGCTLADAFQPWAQHRKSAESPAEAEILCRKLKSILKDPDKGKSIQTVIDAVFRSLKL